MGFFDMIDKETLYQNGWTEHPVNFPGCFLYLARHILKIHEYLLMRFSSMFLTDTNKQTHKTTGMKTQPPSLGGGYDINITVKPRYSVCSSQFRCIEFAYKWKRYLQAPYTFQHLYAEELNINKHTQGINYRFTTPDTIHRVPKTDLHT